QCMNNQKQIVTAIMMYAQEHDEKVPAEQTFWTDIDVPAKVLKCPTADKSIANAYVYNSLIAGKSIGEVDFPADTLACADGQREADTTTTPPKYANIAYANTDLSRRHNNASIVGFLDGHVEMLKDPSMWLKCLLCNFDNTVQMNMFVAGDAIVGPTCAITLWNGEAAEGQYSLKLHYDLPANGTSGKNAYVSMTPLPQAQYPVPVHKMTFFVKGDGNSKLIMVMRFSDKTGECFQHGWNQTVHTVNFTGWKELTYNFDQPIDGGKPWGGLSPDGVQNSPMTFSSFYVQNIGSSNTTGDLLFDHFIIWIG
ncbi:MAG TPA: hypothetical protein VHV83_07195, partial [Armatimonadota bacterium]|nr:hypothetical protein [Armatimonadota bacterium]